MDTTDRHFDCLCRACMSEHVNAFSYDGETKTQLQWLSIFDIIEEKECGSLQIAELLSYAVPQMEVQLSDELPKKICCECLQQLLSVHRFQQMCLQSEEQLRQQVSKQNTDLSIAPTAIGRDMATNDADSYPSVSFPSSSTHKNMEHSSTKEALLETREHVVKPETTETIGVDHSQPNEQLLEDCTDSQSDFSEFIKNEPIEDDEPVVEDSDDGDTIQSKIPAKDEALAIECEEQQMDEMNVKTHRDTQDEDRPYECPYCPQRFKTSSNMVQHKAIHEGAKRVACDICGKSIIKKDFNRHKLFHTNEKAHTCEICEKSFYYSHDLRRHMLQHTGEKPYKCKYCERSFSQSGHRIMHMRVHLGGVNTYRCEFCPSKFLAVKELRLHLTKHKNENTETRERNMKALKEAEARLERKLSKKETQQPSLQQFEIKARENLKKNHLIHNEDRPYECPLCPRRFKTYSNMYQHKAIHEGIDREACDICGKSIIKRSLKEHKLTHSNVKAYECDFCGKRFAHIWYLRRHIPTHTGEKKYKCNYCERTFVRSQDQMNHMRVHLGLNIHRCVLCPLAFPAAKELRMHLTTHKNEDSETRERNMKALHEAEIKLQQKIFVEETQPSKEEKNKK